MRRVVLVSTIALLALAIMIISPVKAMTKGPYWDHVEGSITGYPAKAWQAGPIMHIEGLPFVGSCIGTLGTGTMEVFFEHITVNTETGDGTSLATWTVIVGENTLSGTANGRITGGLAGIGEGYFRGAEGTGEFEGIEKMGTYTVNLGTGVLDCEGVIIYH